MSNPAPNRRMRDHKRLIYKKLRIGTQLAHRVSTPAVIELPKGKALTEALREVISEMGRRLAYPHLAHSCKDD
jgi:hypothetical protein